MNVALGVPVPIEALDLEQHGSLQALGSMDSTIFYTVAGIVECDPRTEVPDPADVVGHSYDHKRNVVAKYVRVTDENEEWAHDYANARLCDLIEAGVVCPLVDERRREVEQAAIALRNHFSDLKCSHSDTGVALIQRLSRALTAAGVAH